MLPLRSRSSRAGYGDALALRGVSVLMKFATSVAISLAAVSMAKCGPSTMCTSAWGTSRRYDSGSEGSKDDSYFPQMTSRRGYFSASRLASWDRR
jgi:hypothetical protein